MNIDAREKVAHEICRERFGEDGEFHFPNSWDYKAADAAIAAYLEALEAEGWVIFQPESVTRVDIIGNTVHEIWADEFGAHLQDDGHTLKLYQFGDGCAAKAERNKAFAADVSARIREMHTELRKTR